MSNIYLLSDELCDICNIEKGTSLHIKIIIHKVKDYIFKNKLYLDLCDLSEDSLSLFYCDSKLEKIFDQKDKNLSQYNHDLINELKEYIISKTENIDETQALLDIYNYHMDYIDVYLEQSNHVFPYMNLEGNKIINIENKNKYEINISTKQSWKNRNGLLHRINGPALITSETKQWWINGSLHRDDGPAVENDDGIKKSKIWYINNYKHRIDGPALECSDGYREWWINNTQLTEEEYNLYLKSL